MGLLDVKVSIFKNYNSPDNPQEVNLLTFLKSKKYKAEVEMIRATQDKKERDKLKSKLPAITPSGLFSRREEAALLTHSGLIQIDIDGHDNTHISNFVDLKEQLCRLREIAYLGLSASGRGFWGLVPLAFPNRHKEQFEALQIDFAGRGLLLDDKPKNVASLRGYSYDPEAYFNPKAKPYIKILEPRPEIYRGQYSGKTTERDAEKMEACLAAIEAGRIDITKGVTDVWFPIGVGIAKEFGESGRDYFHRVSQFHPDYNFRQCEAEYNRCLRKCTGSSVNIATFYYYAEQEGVTFKEALQTSPKEVVGYITKTEQKIRQTAIIPAVEKPEIKPQEEPKAPPATIYPEQPKTTAQSPKPTQNGILPPGWQYETLANGNRVLLAADQLPALWIAEPETELEKLAIMRELKPELCGLVERFGLEVIEPKN